MTGLLFLFCHSCIIDNFAGKDCVNNPGPSHSPAIQNLPAASFEFLSPQLSLVREI